MPATHTAMPLAIDPPPASPASSSPSSPPTPHPAPPPSPTTALFHRVTASETIPLQLICAQLPKHHLLRLRLANRALCSAVSTHVTTATCAPDSPPLRQPLTTLFPYLHTLILSHYPTPSGATPHSPPLGLVPFLQQTIERLPDALRCISHLQISLHGSYDLTASHAEPIHELLGRCLALQTLKLSTPDFTVTLRAPPPTLPLPLAPAPTLHPHLSSLPPGCPLLDPPSWPAHPNPLTLTLHTASDTTTTALLLPALHTPALAHLTLDTPLPPHWLTHTLLTALTTPPLPLATLTHLHFSPAPPAPDTPPDPLLAAVPHLPALRHLHLSPPAVVWSPWHDPHPPFTVPPSWSTLTHLTHLSLWDAALPSLRHLPLLRHLTHSAPTTPPVSTLYPLAALTHLNLRLHYGAVRPSMWAVHNVRAFPPAWRGRLRHLELPCHNAAAALPQLTALTHLHLTCFPMTPDLPLALAQLPNLVHLHLSEPVPRTDPPPTPPPPTPLAARPPLRALKSLQIFLSSNWSWDPLHLLATHTRLPPTPPTITSSDRCTVTDPRRLPPSPLHHWSPCWLAAALTAEGEISIPLLDPLDISVLSAASMQLLAHRACQAAAAPPRPPPPPQQQVLLYAGSTMSHAQVHQALQLACATFSSVSLYCHGWGEAPAGQLPTGSSSAALPDSAPPQDTPMEPAPPSPSDPSTPTHPPATTTLCDSKEAAHRSSTPPPPPSEAPASPSTSTATTAASGGPITITPLTATLATAGGASAAAVTQSSRPPLQQALESLGLHSPPPSCPAGPAGTLAGLRRVHIDCRGLPCQPQLVALVAAAPHLEYLAATNAAHVTDRLLEQLHSSCPQLQHLWLSGMGGGVTSAGLLPLLVSLRGLRGVTLHWCWEWVSAVYPWVPETVYSRLAAACPAAALAWHKADSSTVELTLRRIVCEPCL